MVTLARRLHEFEAEVGLEDLPETVWDGVTSPGRAMQPRHAGFLTNLYKFDNMTAPKWLAIAVSVMFQSSVRISCVKQNWRQLGSKAAGFPSGSNCEEDGPNTVIFCGQC